MELFKDLLSNNIIYIIAVGLVGFAALKVTKTILKISAIFIFGNIIVAWILNLL